MKIWLDDDRNPEFHGCSDYVWYKDGRQFIWDMDEIESEVTHIHLDHYLLDRHITGLEVFYNIMFDLEEDGKFKKLEAIYIHTSCDDAAKKYMEYEDVNVIKEKYNVEIIRKKLNY